MTYSIRTTFDNYHGYVNLVPNKTASLYRANALNKTYYNKISKTLYLRDRVVLLNILYITVLIARA